MKRIMGQHRLIITALATLVLGSALGQRHPWHIDEVRFVGVALEMLQTHNWLVPHRAGEIYADKPPVYFWLLAAMLKITGSVRWGFLLPGIASGIATLLLVYDLGSRWWNRQTGFCAAILLLASYQFWRIATSAHIDSFLVFLTTLGIYGFARHALSGKDTIWFYTGFAAVAAGVLTKGVGFLPLLIFIPYAWARYRMQNVAAILRQQWISGVAILLALLLCWLVPLILRASSDAEIHRYLDNILLQQTGKRFTNAWQHREPFWFFFANIPQYWAPLSLLLPWLIPAWWRRLSRHDTRYTLLLGWVALVLLFFSLSSGKRELYILPALPITALTAAPATLLLLRHRWVNRITTGITALLITTTAVAALVRITGSLPESRIATWPISTGWALLLIATLITAIAIALRKRTNGIITSLIAYAMLAIFYHRILLPILDESMSGRLAMQKLSQDTLPAALALIEWNERHWLYSRNLILHNGYGSKAEANLCGADRKEFRWVMSRDMAEKLDLPVSDSFRLQRKSYVTSRPTEVAHCNEQDEFRYRFEWDKNILEVMDH